MALAQAWGPMEMQSPLDQTQARLLRRFDSVIKVSYGLLSTTSKCLLSKMADNGIAFALRTGAPSVADSQFRNQLVSRVLKCFITFIWQAFPGRLPLVPCVRKGPADQDRGPAPALDLRPAQFLAEATVGAPRRYEWEKFGSLAGTSSASTRCRERPGCRLQTQSHTPPWRSRSRFRPRSNLMLHPCDYPIVGPFVCTPLDWPGLNVLSPLWQAS